MQSLARPFLHSLALLLACSGATANTPPPNPDWPPAVDQVVSIPFEGAPGSWTLVVLPDTQNLVRLLPQAYQRQLDWVAAHKDSHNIRMVLHAGDITDNNVPEQWKTAREGFTTLIEAGVPFSLALGNHDIGPNGKAEDRTTYLNDYFTPADYANSESVGYFEPGRLDNTWHTFNTPTGKFLAVSLEFAPRDAVLEWANEAIAAHPDHKVVIVTHAYMYHNDTRYNWETYEKSQRASPKVYGIAKNGDANDAEDMWNKLVSRHKNIVFVLSGHVLGDGTGYLASTGEHGNNVHQILANYQAAVQPRRPWNGGAFLRLMEFSPDGKTVQVRSYSPWTNEWLTTPDQAFTLQLD